MIPGGPNRPDIREYLAAERTLLAWIRTGLAIVAFGFLVARVGRMDAEPGMRGTFAWFGLVVVSMGVILNVLSLLEYRSLVRQINLVQAASVAPARLGVLTAAAVAVCGTVLGAFIIMFP